MKKGSRMCIIIGLVMMNSLCVFHYMESRTGEGIRSTTSINDLTSSDTQNLLPHSMYGIRAWSRLGESISYNFSTSPATTINIWAMDETQWYNSEPEDMQGTLLLSSESGAGTFFPQYEAKWLIVFHNYHSYSTILTYTVEFSPCIVITNPVQSTTIFTESDLRIEWETVHITGGIIIDLYKGASYLTTLDALTPNDGIEYCQIPEDCIDGSDYRIKLAAPSSGEIDYSDPFSIIRRKIVVSRPKITHTFIPHTTERIEWYSYGTSSKVRIDLFLNNTHILEIANETADDTYHLWTVWQGSSYANITSSHYQIRIQDIINPKYVDFSSNFTITNEKYLTIRSPTSNSSFKAGNTMNLQWETDTPCEEIYIELLRGNTTVKKITVDNINSYKMIIPDKLGGDIDYRILITAVDNSASDISEYFTVSPKLRISGYNNITLLSISIILISICIYVLKFRKIARSYHDLNFKYARYYFVS